MFEPACGPCRTTNAPSPSSMARPRNRNQGDSERRRPAPIQARAEACRTARRALRRLVPASAESAGVRVTAEIDHARGLARMPGRGTPRDRRPGSRARGRCSRGKRACWRPIPRIVLEGFVEDVRPAYRAADVVAVPLPLSAGTNIKLMEAMACGRAIVSTPAGAAASILTNGRELIVAELDASFASCAGRTAAR